MARSLQTGRNYGEGGMDDSGEGEEENEEGVGEEGMVLHGGESWHLEERRGRKRGREGRRDGH